MVAGDDWDLSYKFLTSRLMGDMIGEALADDMWAFNNGHEQGARMEPEEMYLHEDLDYDDDTALNRGELAQAMDNLELAHLDDECNIVAPEDSIDDVEVLDDDTLSLESESESEVESDEVMVLD